MMKNQSVTSTWLSSSRLCARVDLIREALDRKPKKPPAVSRNAAPVRAKKKKKKTSASITGRGVGVGIGDTVPPKGTGVSRMSNSHLD